MKVNIYQHSIGQLILMHSIVQLFGLQTFIIIKAFFQHILDSLRLY